MVKDIIENNEYKSLVEKQIKETILFLLEKNQEFSITANIEPITFTPELPKVIKDQMHKFSLLPLHWSHHNQCPTRYLLDIK